MYRIFLIISIIIFGSINLKAQVAPDFTATDVNGFVHALYPTLNEERTIIINFFFLECTPCEYYMTDLVELEAEYGGTTGGVEIWVLSKQDESEELAAYALENNYPFYFFGVDGGSFKAITAFENTFDTVFYPNYTVVCPDASATFDIWPVTDNIWEIESVMLQCNYDVSIPSIIKNSIFVYPNPADDVLFLSNNNSAEFFTIKSMDGRIVKRLSGEQDQIAVHDIPSGIYLLTGFNSNTQLFNITFLKK